MDTTGQNLINEPNDAQIENPLVDSLAPTPVQEIKTPKSKVSKTPKEKSEPVPEVLPETFEDFLSQLINHPKKPPEINRLPDSDLEIAAEIRNAFLNHEYQIKKRIKLESVDAQKLHKLVKLSTNGSFLTEIFIRFHGSPIGDLALNRILREIKKYPEFSQILEIESKKSHFQNLLLNLAALLKSNTDDYRELRWWLLLHISEPNLIQFTRSSTWMTLKGKSEELFKLPGIQLSQILRKISKDRVIFLEFLIHLEIEKSSKSKIVLLKKVLEGVFVEDLLALIFVAKKEINRNFIEILFIESLQNKLDLTRTLEGCLPFYLLDGIYPNIFGGDRIKRSWKRVQLAENGLVEKFRSDDVNRLSNDLEQLTGEFLEKKIEIEDLTARLKATQNELQKSRLAQQNLEERLRERVSGQNSGNLAIERQIRINQLRSVVEVLEPEISKENGSRIPLALERIGIKRIGIPGETLDWDSSICESITGMEILNPMVIKSGYTWTEGGDISVLIKALVKPRK